MGGKGSGRASGGSQFSTKDRDRAVAAGKKGQAALRKNKVEPLELGDLKDHEDARRWLEAVGQRVVKGQLDNRDAQAAVRCVSEWVKLEADRLTAVVVSELSAYVKRLQRELSGTKPRMVK